MRKEDKKFIIFWLGLNLVITIVLFSVILISLAYKSVPVSEQHIFDDLHSYRIYLHSSITALWLIVLGTINGFFAYQIKSANKEEQPKE